MLLNTLKTIIYWMISTLTRLPDSDSKMSQWKLNVAYVAHTIFF